MNIHGHQFRLVIIPDWDEVHILVAASAHVTNEELLSVSSISDVITFIA